MQTAYLVVFVAISAGCLAALIWRYRRISTCMSTISIDAVSRWYGNVVAVNGISMTVGPGVTGLLGPNGAGKTTLIALMSGFLAPSAGSVTLDGTAIWRHTDAYKTIGLVPEREVSFGYLTGRQFVLANAELHGLPDPGAAAQRALEIVEMVEPAERRIGTYSKGMRQRAKLASALVHDPAVLLLDEPFNGVDPRQRLHLMALLRQMGAEGRTVLFSSHILEEVEQVARQIEVMVSGRHAASGDFGQIRRLMTDRPGAVRRRQRRRPHPGQRPHRRALRGRRLAALRRAASTSSVSDFGAFAVRLPRLARDHGVRILELAPTDESLESVFAYLVGAMTMNSTIARLSAQALFGRRRGVVLVLIPGLLVALAIIVRALTERGRRLRGHGQPRLHPRPPDRRAARVRRGARPRGRRRLDRLPARQAGEPAHGRLQQVRRRRGRPRWRWAPSR